MSGEAPRRKPQLEKALKNGWALINMQRRVINQIRTHDIPNLTGIALEVMHQQLALEEAQLAGMLLVYRAMGGEP